MISATEQLIDGHIDGLAEDVPKSIVDGALGTPFDRSAPPKIPIVQFVPDFLDLQRIGADQILLRPGYRGHNLLRETERVGERSFAQAK